MAIATPNLASMKSGSKFADLRRRLIFLVLALLVFRIGAHIPVPGIDPDQLAQLFDSQSGGILGMFNLFSGGALSRFTVFALGIMPYISASIIMQLLTIVLPTLEAMKKRWSSRSKKNHAVHALCHIGVGNIPSAWYCDCIRGTSGIGD